MLEVLIADDEAIERRYLSSVFQKHPGQFHVAGEAQNGQEIIDLAMRTKPDIIIMDINMPMVNGLESANRIKQRFPETLILLNTAYAEFEFARKAVEYNLDAYLLKPAKEEQILEAIKKCLRKRTPKPVSSASLTDSLTGTSANAVSIVTDYINKNYQKPLTLQELSTLAHFSPSYLSKLFHQTKGMTIKAYMNQKRLENAEYLLKNSDLTIQEVSQHCGFSNVSHFNRVFKQHTGSPPLEFRHLYHE